MDNENVIYNLGADPEFFLFFRPEGMGPIPIAAHIADIPYKAEEAEGWLDFDGTNSSVNRWSGKFFRDGVALELNPTFSHCRQVLTHNMRGLLRHLDRMLGKKGFSMSPQAGLHFPMDQIRSGPSDVQRWGCNPTLSAYDPGVPKVPPMGAMNTDIRTTGGHIHITVREGSEGCVLAQSERYPDLIQLMDLYVGAPFTYLLGHQVGNSLRRTLYGVAGEYREIEKGGYVGVEYRVLPAGMWNTAWLASLALGSVREVVRRFEELLPTLGDVNSRELQQAINECDGQACAEMVHPLPGFFSIETLRRVRHMVPLTLRLHKEKAAVNMAGWGGFLRGQNILPPSTGVRLPYDPNNVDPVRW